MAFQFAISATFTAEPIETALKFWSRRLKWPVEVRFAPYNQVAQTLLDPSSLFGRNTNGVNAVLLRPEDLAEAAHFHELLELIRRARQNARVPFIVMLCPPVSPELIAAAVAAFRDVPGLTLLLPDEVERLYPVDEAYSREGDRLGRIAYTELYLAALGTALARRAYALVSPPFKLIVLDCDNTLWDGICGEDGARGIVIDAGRRALQQFMIGQRDAGMLLALASKNNEQDVLDAFEHNPGMPLRLEHFVARRINWDRKSRNLESLAAELSLAPDSFIFVDDNAVECAEVQENLSPVLTLALPPDPARIASFLDHVWAFDHPAVTAEDRRRSESYAQTLAFGRELQVAGSMEHFLETLNLRVTFVAPEPERLGRIEQLTQRTNQFNFTTIRRTASEIAALLANGEMQCLGVEVSDRFGDYGLTGVVMFRVIDEALEVDTFLLSCRVLGRGVEHVVMVRLAEEARKRGASYITGEIRTTARNQPARQFLHSLPVEIQGDHYRLPVAAATQIGWTPAEPASQPAPGAAQSPQVNRPDYAHIAKHLATAPEILAAIRAEARGNDAVKTVAWESETEAALATIWSELLHASLINPNDNFFDLGGHSLVVVLLIVRLREVLGVELPIEDVYSGDMTLRALARTIDRHKAGDDAEYQALLEEIERMSDDEVARLLAEESDAYPADL